MHMLKDISTIIKAEVSLLKRIQTSGSAVAKAWSKREPEVRLADGKGTVQLNHILHVPDITHNLSSVSSLCDTGYTVLLAKDKCTVQKKRIKHLASVTREFTRLS